MPLRKQTKTPLVTKIDQERRRTIKTANAKVREAKLMLRREIDRIGGEIVDLGNHKFKLNFKSINIRKLPEVLFEDPFVYEYCVQSLVSMNVSHNKLTEIDDELGDFIAIENLDLSHNKLKKLPRTFSQFTSLVKLNVTYNQLKKLPKNLHKCTKLEIFYAEHNFIKFLPKNLGFLPSAVFVNLSDNKLLSIPSSMYSVKKLLVLRNNNIGFLPAPVTVKKSVFEKRPWINSIRAIEVSNNKISMISQNFVLKELRTLNIACNELEELPQSICQSTQLVSLILNDNQLTRIPTSMKNLENLKVLDLRNNLLKYLPDELSELKKLVTLDCAKNDISSVPKNFKDLKSLQCADLSQNRFAHMPAMSYMSKLSTINLSKNCINEIGDVNNLPSLVKFDLSSNKLEKLPENIGSLKNLDSFKANDNELTCLPSSLSLLKSIKTLDVSNNQISSIDNSMRRLCKLETLKVGGNQIEKLPVPFTFMRNLRNLDLSENEFHSFDENSAMPKTIRKFKLKGNEIEKGRLSNKMMHDLRMIVSLDLSSSNLEVLPEQACRLLHLRHLNLSCNKLNDLPAGVGRWLSILDIDVSHNRLRSLPRQVKNGWKFLLKLSASHNMIGLLPDSYSNLPMLKVIDVSHNCLKDFPPGVLSIKSLEEVDANNNQINYLQALPLNQNCEGDNIVSPNLKKVDLHDNCLTFIEGDLRAFNKVKYFDLSNNNLVEIPNKAVICCKNLRHFNISNNKITKLPFQIRELIHLEEFSFANNSVKEIPPTIKNCKHLTKLDFAGNNVSTVPVGLFRMHSLKHVKATGNPCEAEVPIRLTRVNKISQSENRTTKSKNLDDMPLYVDFSEKANRESSEKNNKNIPSINFTKRSKSGTQQQFKVQPTKSDLHYTQPVVPPSAGKFSSRCRRQATVVKQARRLPKISNMKTYGVLQQHRAVVASK